jgi:hypothetical protein
MLRDAPMLWNLLPFLPDQSQLRFLATVDPDRLAQATLFRSEFFASCIRILSGTQSHACAVTAATVGV